MNCCVRFRKHTVLHAPQQTCSKLSNHHFVQAVRLLPKVNFTGMPVKHPVLWNLLKRTKAAGPTESWVLETAAVPAQDPSSDAAGRIRLVWPAFEGCVLNWPIRANPLTMLFLPCLFCQDFLQEDNCSLACLHQHSPGTYFPFDFLHTTDK